MTSAIMEPPTLRYIPSAEAEAAVAITSTSSNRRSYMCYNCNYSFHITPATSASAPSPSSFRCPQCHHRHLIPHHTVSHPPPAPPPPLPPPRPQRSNSTPVPGAFTYYTSDEFDSDYDYDYDSDNSLVSFTIPNLCQSTPASKSFVDSLPVKFFPPNSISSIQSCSICMEDFDSDPDSFVTINELPCLHYFHKDCIVEWLNRSNTCPLCRYKLPVDPGAEEGAVPALSPGDWETEFEAFASPPLPEPAMRRVAAQVNLSSIAEAPVPARRMLSMNRGERSIWGVDAMRDEDGDTLMLDASQS